MNGWRGVRLSRRAGQVNLPGLRAPHIDGAAAARTRGTGAMSRTRDDRGRRGSGRAADVAGGVADTPPSATGGTGVSTAPIVILTYANAGGTRVSDLLEEHADLACTSGTGLLPLCNQALVSWQLVDERRVSALAVASVRRLAAGMINALLLRFGATRWCEMAIAQLDAAESFLRVFPETRFLCLQRSAPDVIRAVVRSGWGATGQAFAPYVSAHPASPVAAITEYWVAHAGPLLDFEHAHPEACLRVTYEDLTTRPDDLAHDLADFLGLPPLRALPELDDTIENTIQDADTGDPGDAEPHGAGTTPSGPSDDLPVRHIPAPLLAEVNRLHARLGYPELPTG